MTEEIESQLPATNVPIDNENPCVTVMKIQKSFIIHKPTPICNMILKSDSCSKFYTGLTRNQRMCLWDFLGEAKDKLSIIGTEGTLSGQIQCMSLDCQFLMTLLILRRDRLFEDIAFQFDLDRNVVARIFKTWVQFIFWKFKDIQTAMFTKRKDLPRLPSVFRNKLLRNTRCVIDCTELVIESARNYNQQGNIYSAYKSRPTAKILVATNPNGAAVYISDAFEGSISDVKIVEKSGFLDFIENGDIILADRGFTIDHLLVKRGAKVVMPPMMKGKSALSLPEESITKVIAKARIHIERWNERLKLFEWLRTPIRQDKRNMLSQGVYVCSCLANFSRIMLDTEQN